MPAVPPRVEPSTDRSINPPNRPRDPRTRAEAADRVRILDVAIDDLAFDDAVAILRVAVRDGSRRTLFFANAHTLDLARRSPAFRDTLNAADLVFGDGTGVRWAARMQGVRLRANLNGTDLIPAFMRAADDDGLRYYLLGARPEVVARTAEVTSERFPGWTLAGHHHGFLDAVETERVVAAINAMRPHLLLVGMGNPLQEAWIAANRDRLEVKLIAGVGGLFSYLSGDYRRASPALRRFGFEWLAVLLTQRQKWRRYVVGAPMFLACVLAERLSRRRAA